MVEGQYHFDSDAKSSQHGSLTYGDAIVPLVFSCPDEVRARAGREWHALVQHEDAGCVVGDGVANRVEDLVEQLLQVEGPADLAGYLDQELVLRLRPQRCHRAILAAGRAAREADPRGSVKVFRTTLATDAVAGRCRWPHSAYFQVRWRRRSSAAASGSRSGCAFRSRSPCTEGSSTKPLTGPGNAPYSCAVLATNKRAVGARTAGKCPWPQPARP